MTIAERRVELGLSVRALALRLRVSPLKVEAWEAGESMPYRSFRAALAAALGWTEEQVCAGLPDYEQKIAARTEQIIRAHGKCAPSSGPGSDAWMRDQLNKMRASSR